MPREMYVTTLKEIFNKIITKVNKKKNKELIEVCKTAIGTPKSNWLTFLCLDQVDKD